MANQIIIDIGAVANDGTGDPLRTAFGFVNNNFSNVWATGVANSNIAFDGNRLLTTNTNGNLVLAPNGTGKVQANVDIVPSANNAQNLGSLTRQWNTVYAQNLAVGGNVEFGDLTVDGNLTVTGNIIQIGNIVTDSKTIQLANTALTANSANGSGITVGASDDIATMLYSSTSNTWDTNIGITATGNITGTYFIGNGALLTGITSYSNTNATSLLASFGSNTISTTGNITAGYFVGNGSLLTGITSYTNANAVAYGESGWGGNIVPSGNAVYSLGNATNQWNDLYVSNATIFMNNVPISLTAGNVLTVNGADVVTTSANGESNVGNLEITGTVVAIADGAPDTLISITPSGPVSGWAYLQLPTNDTANATDTRLHNDAGNIEFGTGDFSTGETNYTWTLDNTGNLTLPSNGNINGADGSFARFQSVDEGIVRSGVILNPGDGLIRLESWDNENFESFTSADWSSATYVADEGGGYIAFIDAPNILNLANSIETSRLTLQVNGGAFLPQNGFNTSGNNITFFVTTAPEDSPETVIDFTMAWTPRSRIEMDYDEGELSLQAQDLDITITSNQEIDIRSSDRIRIENSSTVNGITIATDTANAFLTWTFDIAGNLNLPRGGVVHETNIPYGGFTGNTIALVPQGGTSADQQLMIYPTAGADANHLHLTTGNLWNTEMFLGNDDFYVKLANTGNIVINSNDGNSNTAQWTFGTAGTILNSGNLTIQTPSGIPTSVSNWQGQGGWNQAFYSNVATTGGTGSGLTVDVAAAGAGYISINDITINTPGTGYTNGDVITIDNENNLPGTFNVSVVVNDWTFDTTGVLTVPGNIVMPAGSSLVGNGASPAPNISGFNSATFGANVTATGNITGGNILTGGLISATGNVTGNYFIGNGSQLTGLSGNIANITANVITFNTSAGVSVDAGQMAWNSADGTVDIGLGYADVVLQVGQETHYVVRNDTGNIIENGTAVYCSGVTAGSGRIEASPMMGNIDAVKFLGLSTQDISNGVNGVVTYFGYVRGLDTRGTANTAISVGDETWAVGDQLYVHPTAAGKLTNVEPAAPNVKICVASILIRNQTAGVVFVRPTTNLYMTDLSDVQITTPAVNQFLVYAGNRWQNTALDISVDTSPTLGGNLAGAGFNISNVGTITATGNITGNTAGFAIGYRDIPQVSFTGNATIATTDAGKHFYSTQSSNFTLTIANNASQGFQVGAAITVVNQGTGTITIAQGADVTLYLAGNATSGNRSVATFGMATIMKVATNTWFINGTGVS